MKERRPVDDAARYSLLARQSLRAACQAGFSAFDRGAFFEAHEWLEAVWRELTDADDRDYVQGILQAGVGYYHWQRQNPAGAMNLLSRALDRLTPLLAKGYAPPAQNLIQTDLARLLPALSGDLHRLRVAAQTPETALPAVTPPCLL